MLRRLSLFLQSVGLVLLLTQSAAFAGSTSVPAPTVRQPASVETYADSSSAPLMPTLPLPSQAPATANAQAAVGTGGYVLGIGDRIKLNVYGEESLSGEYEVGSMGIIALPLIGDTKAAGTSLGDFERAVRIRLMEGYLKDPKVNAQVVNYRPFFILGEVSKPGSYPYVNGMTVLNAVALAGGYTYRGDRTEITLSHAGDTDKNGQRVNEETPVMPGDIIRVPERFF